MTVSQLSTIPVEQQLLSKQAIRLQPKERLALLLKAKRYPIVKKRTSAESQIKEMLDLYKLYCLMLAQYFPNEEAENTCFFLTLVATQENQQTTITARLAEAFKMLDNYEELERKITAIQILFEEYREKFPNIYERYNLEEITQKRISDMIRDSRQLRNNPLWVNEVMKRWELS